MLDGFTNDDSGLETATEEEVVTTAADNDDEGNLAENTETDTSEDEEFEEVERAGKKYRIPAALKGELMMQSDYTKKTQEVSETRKALEAREAEIAQQAERVKELSADHKRLAIIDDYLERQQSTNWAKLFDDEPLDAPRKWAEYQHWQHQRQTLHSKIETTETERAHEMQRETAKQIDEGRKVLERDIKGWSPETAQKVAQFAISSGLTAEQVSSIHDPILVKILHKAWLGDQLARKTQTAAKNPAAAAEPVKPLTPVAKGRTAPTRSGPSDDMSADEWVAARNRQLRNK